jgi:hypothetical protein
MLRSFFSRKVVLVALAIATTLAFTTAVMPALGGPTAFLSKKKKAKPGPPGPQGPAGPQGPQGPQGNAGAPATKLLAVVDFGGTLIRGSGTVGTDMKHGDGTGVYDVLFNQDVSNCSFQATPAQTEDFLWAETGFQGSGSVRVVGHNAAGTAENVRFNVAVFC